MPFRSISCCSLRLFPTADPFGTSLVDVSVGMCSRHNLHHTDHTGNGPGEMVYNALLIYKGRLVFLHFDLVLDLSSDVNWTDFCIYLVAEVSKLSSN